MHPSRPVVVWWLAGGLVVSSALAAKFVFDKRRLATAYEQAKVSLAQLERERTHLSQELAQAKETMTDQAEEIGSLEQELNNLQSRFDLAEQEVWRLQTEQLALREANDGISRRLAAAVQDKQALEARLSSLKELKLAMQAVRRKLRDERWQAWLARIRVQRVHDQQQLANGNRGYVVRNGVPTLGEPTRLQVRVLDPQTP
ncbi:MAG: hypothetical protein HYY91_03020 [Candidatus Omnitrophica bacterium]|nr:hypothetical protein [Candidatus Omnitrophota bacterium]